jgi:hypothetical protein
VAWKARCDGGEEGSGSFLKKRTKKLSIHFAVLEQAGRAQREKSLFASFSSEKEDSFESRTI